MVHPAAHPDHPLSARDGVSVAAAAREEGRMRSPVLVAALVLLTACGSSPPDSGSTDAATIRVASYDFRENQILAEVYAEGLRRQGLPVTVQHGIGTREVVSPALQQGVVDVVIDYLGTALSFVRAGDG